MPVYYGYADAVSVKLEKQPGVTVVTRIFRLNIKDDYAFAFIKGSSRVMAI